MAGDATANALRTIVASALPGEPLVDEAAGILLPAETQGGQTSFRFVAPLALILILVFGALHLGVRRAGGYRVERLAEGAGGASRVAPLILLLLLAACSPGGERAPLPTPTRGRLKVLFLGDDGHHRPAERGPERDACARRQRNRPFLHGSYRGSATGDPGGLRRADPVQQPPGYRPPGAQRPPRVRGAMDTGWWSCTRHRPRSRTPRSSFGSWAERSRATGPGPSQPTVSRPITRRSQACHPSRRGTKRTSTRSTTR